MTTKNIVISGTCPGTPDGGMTNGTMTPVTYIVPAGKRYQVCSMRLSNKFPYDFVSHRTMYLEASFGWAVSAHAPYMDFNPPFDLPAGTEISLYVLNGMTETQNIYGLIGGKLLSA